VATVHLTQIVNSNKVEIYLCEHCAREKGSLGIGSSTHLNEFLSGLMGLCDSGPYVMRESNPLRCDKCGMSYEEFQKIGKLGCNSCYEAFEEKLKPIVKRLHGSAEHTGKIPGKTSEIVAVSKEIAKLKEQLNKSILSENYEKAAEYRDKIRALETSSISDKGSK
jgi:protein arginine kinase activator